jgi:hypothetical protein
MLRVLATKTRSTQNDSDMNGRLIRQGRPFCLRYRILDVAIYQLSQKVNSVQYQESISPILVEKV